MKRMRGRGGNRHGGGQGGGGHQYRSTNTGGHQPMNRNHVFDSSGPDMRLRGTAQQLFEKYLQLGRDATGAGDRVMAESYFQHAEHYFRILNAMNQAAAAQQEQYQQRRGPRGGGEGYDQQGQAEGEAQQHQPGEVNGYAGDQDGEAEPDPREAAQ